MTTPEDQVPEEPTRRLDPTEAEYSATALASHWFTRPEEEGATATVPEQGEPVTVPVGGFTRPPSQVAPATVPDRMEGTVLRFGPGVTAATAHRNHSTLPVTLPPPVPRSSPRRYALPALVFLCVLAFLAWHRLGPSVEVRSVSVTARPAELGCGETAQILAQVTTNGRPGTFSYRWFRSDGTSSHVLRERLPRGRRHVTLSLLWTFEGKGHHAGRAELRVLTPSVHTAVTRLTYDCR
ncbi:hypothetical protein ABZ446_41750 [Streptomyces sp. NPDC005813]|uniref:hypothetical protein n=1 Tax=Streptomyces sp. NPDC005813 TaxID=3155592 RepID=UPI0033D0C377